LLTRRVKMEQCPETSELGITQNTEYNKPYECWCSVVYDTGFFPAQPHRKKTLLFSECLLTNIPFFWDVTLRGWISGSRRFERICHLRLQGDKVMSRHTVILDWTALTTSELAYLFLYILRQLISEDGFYFLLPVCYLNSYDIRLCCMLHRGFCNGNAEQLHLAAGVATCRTKDTFVLWQQEITKGHRILPPIVTWQHSDVIVWPNWQSFDIDSFMWTWPADWNLQRVCWNGVAYGFLSSAYRGRLRWNFFIIKPTRCTNFTNLFLAWNSTCFAQFFCPSSGVYSLYTQHWYMSYRFVGFHPDPARKLSINL
jgi:hypothetical protein